MRGRCGWRARRERKYRKHYYFVHPYIILMTEDERKKMEKDIKNLIEKNVEMLIALS